MSKQRNAIRTRDRGKGCEPWEDEDRLCARKLTARYALRPPCCSHHWNQWQPEDYRHCPVFSADSSIFRTHSSWANRHSSKALTFSPLPRSEERSTSGNWRGEVRSWAHCTGCTEFSSLPTVDPFALRCTANYCYGPWAFPGLILIGWAFWQSKIFQRKHVQKSQWT